MIKNISKKPTTNIIFNDEKLSLPNDKIRSKSGTSLFITPFQHLTEVLANAIGQEKEIKRTLIGKEEIKLSLFADDMIVYVENLKQSTEPSGTNKQL